MGKKSRDKKRGKGAEKTAARTDKKLLNKQKKELTALGEDDIEHILAEIDKENQKRQKITEVVVEHPSRRVNFSFIAHPDKEELVLFGGEFFNGQKTFVYNDLFIYNIPHNQWLIIKAPGAPPPRCGHQMVANSADKGQLWLFGGEFASATQSQFYHYRDLWVFYMATKKWEKVTVPGGPSARSGHRMIYHKKQLFIFGGYHDNLRVYKYFNDLHVFNLETYTWSKLEVSGVAPAPRSGCNMLALPDGRILIFGGYSKERIKKDVDKGHIYSDMFALTPDKNDPTRFRWVSVKQSGVHITPRCSVSTTAAPNNRAYSFGGVFDVEDNEEDLNGNFFNDLHCLDLERITWSLLTVSGKRNQKKCADKNDVKEEEMEVEQETMTVSTDGVFTVTVGPGSSVRNQAVTTVQKSRVFQPPARMNCGLAVKHGVLYLYGGLLEDGTKQLTLYDFYSLDLRKMDEWKTIIADDLKNQEWLGSESESEDSNSEPDSEEESSDDSVMDTD